MRNRSLPGEVTIVIIGDLAEEPALPAIMNNTPAWGP
jgi:hypothetical protein